MTLRDLKLKPKGCQFGNKRSCFRQSNAFDKSVRTAAHTLFLSRVSLIFSIITKRKCCTLQHFRKPHWCLGKKLSKYVYIYEDLRIFRFAIYLGIYPYEDFQCRNGCF